MKPQTFTDEHGSKKRFVNKISVSTCVCLWLIFLAFQVSAQTYNNPVIPGDFPDPSVIRVGEDFYATATTGGWSPHFPILHSTNLINWKIVGAVLEDTPKWAKGDFWAPEITQDKGKFYVFYTARRDDGKGKKGTLCVAVAVSDKPDRDYQDKGTLVCQEMGSIDPDFVRDENGKPFLVWKEDGNDRQKPTWLYAQELTEDLTKLVGQPTKLFRNEGSGWENKVVEGAYVLRRGGYFYLFYSGNACCGRSCNYALGVARSKTLLGTWEKNPANPILAANETWQCPGHGSIVSTADGRDFLLYHAYRNAAAGFNIGREALLDEVKFSDGWATINRGKGASKTTDAPFKNTKQLSIFTASSDEFNENKLDGSWNWSLFQNPPARVADGFLTLSPFDKTPETVIAERTVSGSYQAATRIDVSKSSDVESAGISIYSWRGSAVGASVGAGKIFVWRRENGTQTEAANIALPVDKKQIYLKVQAKIGELFQFSYSFDGANWTNLGAAINGSYIEGARIALTDSGAGKDGGARFDWLRVEPN